MRATDENLQVKITELIESESDPRERTRLLLMLQISTLLIDNVVAVREVTAEFRAHREAFVTHEAGVQRLYNRGWGMWKLAAWVYLIVQGLLGAMYFEHVQQFRELAQQTQENASNIRVIREVLKGRDNDGR